MTNPFKWHKVQFNDGTFGYRRWRMFFYDYLDLQDEQHTWSSWSSLFLQARRGTEEEADEAYQRRLLFEQKAREKTAKRKDLGRPV